MKLSNIVIASVATLALAAPAFAGEASNRITTGWERGTSELKVDNVRTEAGTFYSEEFNIKIDAVGENAGTRIHFDGSKFIGSGFANNIENPDPFVNAGTALNITEGSYTEVTALELTEHADFYESFIEYKLITD